jgi:ADP-ribosyl-[dinitrogen reductase] hydrolase
VIPGSHFRLALLAGASGDCIGRVHEGRAGTVGPLVPEGSWRVSDDTALTLATCRAIVESGRVDPAAVAAEFAREFRGGRLRGLGASTLKALRELAEGAHWATVGRSGEFAAGNGAAMRMAPLAFVLAGETAEDRRLIRDVARITHKSDEAYVAALAVVRAMHLVNAGEERGSLLERLAGELPDTRVRDALHVLLKLPATAAVEEAAATVGTSGHASESVPFALYLAARFRGSCEEAILAAVRCGGDTDTIASIAGQVCGAGGSAIGEAWLARLPVREEIEERAEGLVALAASRAG